MPEPDSTGRVDSNGVEISWYRYDGGDPVVLMVPTWNLVDARVWRPLLDLVVPSVTALTYDPRGAGASDRPPRGYGFGGHMADALAVLDANGIERAAIVTASRGVNVAILLATQQRERVARIAAIAPYMRLEPRPDGADDADAALFATWRRDWAGWARAFMELVFSEPESDEVIERITSIALDASPEVLIVQETELDWADPVQRLSDVLCPVLFVHGGGDRTTPPTLAQEIAAQLPDARLVVLEGAGHRPDIRSPELVAPVLLAFLDVKRRPGSSATSGRSDDRDIPGG